MEDQERVMEQSEIHLRPLQNADRPSLLPIWRRAVESTHEFLRKSDLDEIELEVADYLNTVSSNFWVIEAGTQLVGFMGMSENSIDSLFIDPSVHRQGVGRCCINYARSLYKQLKVDVNEGNTAGLRFYEACGFTVNGRSETDSAGRPFPLLHMITDR